MSFPCYWESLEFLLFNPEVHVESCQTNLVSGLGFLEIHFLVLRAATCHFERGHQWELPPRHCYCSFQWVIFLTCLSDSYLNPTLAPPLPTHLGGNKRWPQSWKGHQLAGQMAWGTAQPPCCTGTGGLEFRSFRGQDGFASLLGNEPRITEARGT